MCDFILFLMEKVNLLQCIGQICYLCGSFTKCAYNEDYEVWRNISGFR
mgnify:CR=1 FL=1